MHVGHHVTNAVLQFCQLSQVSSQVARRWRIVLAYHRKYVSMSGMSCQCLRWRKVRDQPKPLPEVFEAGWCVQDQLCSRNKAGIPDMSACHLFPRLLPPCHVFWIIICGISFLECFILVLNVLKQLRLRVWGCCEGTGVLAYIMWLACFLRACVLPHCWHFSIKILELLVDSQQSEQPNQKLGNRSPWPVAIKLRWFWILELWLTIWFYWHFNSSTGIYSS